MEHIDDRADALRDDIDTERICTGLGCTPTELFYRLAVRKGLMSAADVYARTGQLPFSNAEVWHENALIRGDR